MHLKAWLLQRIGGLPKIALHSGDELTESEKFKFCPNCGRDLRKPAEPEKPLTLEQLKQMDGKPVWATGKRSLGTDVNGWMLVDTTTSRPAALDFIGACNFDSYGKMWTAYAREPVSK